MESSFAKTDFSFLKIFQNITEIKVDYSKVLNTGLDKRSQIEEKSKWQLYGMANELIILDIVKDYK